LAIAPIAGDANMDGTVDYRDIAIVAANLGRSQSSWEFGDFDGDGQTNVLDIVALKQHFGETVHFSSKPTGAAVPEPSSLVTFAIAMICVTTSRRRCR
jgi:hypothetical protein